MDPRPLVYEDFADKVGQPFRVLGLQDLTLDLTLQEAKLLAEINGSPVTRPAFSLMFKGPPEWLLAQQIFRLENAELGEVEIFITAVGKDAEAISYQAIFN
jgi:hypothetical protein